MKEPDGCIGPFEAASTLFNAKGDKIDQNSSVHKQENETPSKKTLSKESITRSSNTNVCEKTQMLLHIREFVRVS